MFPKVSSLTPGAPPVPVTNDPTKIRGAAQQFESLLLAQILHAAHGSSGGWLGSGSDSAADGVSSLADEQLAVMISQQGGLGLRDLIVQGLTKSTK